MSRRRGAGISGWTYPIVAVAVAAGAYGMLKARWAEQELREKQAAAQKALLEAEALRKEAEKNAASGVLFGSGTTLLVVGGIIAALMLGTSKSYDKMLEDKYYEGFKHGTMGSAIGRSS